MKARESNAKAETCIAFLWEGLSQGATDQSEGGGREGVWGKGTGFVRMSKKSFMFENVLKVRIELNLNPNVGYIYVYIVFIPLNISSSWCMG